MKIIPATTLSEFEAIEELAWKIIPDFYAPYVPHEDTLSFVNQHQTTAAIQQQVQKGYTYYFLLSDTDEKAGYLAFREKDQKLMLSKLYILKEYRGYKLGQAGLNFAIEKAKEWNLHQIELTVNQKNSGAIYFYEKNGFVIQKEVLNYFENGNPVQDYIMLKCLE